MGNIVILNSYRWPPPAAPCDTYYLNTVLLLAMDGTDGATTTTDASPSTHTPTFGGTAQLDTDITKFGASSLLLDGDSDYVDIPLSTDFDFGTNPFTIECHFRLDTLAKRHCIISKYGSTLASTADWALTYETSGVFGDERDNHLRFVWTTDGVTIQDYCLKTGTIATDTWYHVAVCRDDTNIQKGLAIYLDGVRQAPSEIDLDSIVGDDVFYSSEPLHIGKINPTVGDKLYMDGNIDNIRITKGYARYLGEFTPPTTAHPTTLAGDPLFANVRVLLPMDGTNGGTTFTDESDNGFTFTPTNVTTSTEQVKYGSASAKMTGVAGNRLTSSDAIIPNTTDSFTIEAWVYLLGAPYSGSSRAASPLHPIVYEAAGGGNSDQGLYIGDPAAGSGKLSFFRGPTVGPTFSVGSGPVFNYNEWYHIACCYDHSITQMSLFVNGVQTATTTVSGGGWINQPSRDFFVGDWYEPGYEVWRASANMHIDDLRITNDVKYTSTFTPPAEAFESTACVVDGDLTLIENFTSVDQTVSNWESGQTWNNFWGWGWKPDGTKFVTVNNSNDRIYGFDFGTPFDFTTTSNNSANPGQTVQVVGLDVMFNEDGTKYSTWSWWSSNTMVTYNAATPYEPKTTDTQISSANFGSYSSGDSESYWIDRSGVHLFIITVGNSPDKIIHFKMSTPWDVTTAVLQSDEFNMDTGGYPSNGRMYMSPTGRDLLFSHSGSSTPLWHFRMSDPYNLNTMVEVSQLDITSFGPRGGGIWMPDDGSKLILGPGANDSYDIQVRTVPVTPQPSSFANVQWLTGFDADPPTDESSYARVIADELISYETTTTKFGAGAGSWGNNSSARISINDVAGLDLLGKDFTLECFVYLLDTSSDHCFASNWHNTSNRSWVWRWDQATSAMQFEYSTTGTTSAGTLSASWSPSTSTWYHVAVARNGNDLRFFVDGTQIGTTQTLSATLFDSSRQKHMGFSNNSVRGLYGYMDEARWIIDECIYTSNFVAPTVPHPRS